MIQGAIFDVDGTLLDSMPVWDTLAEDYLRTQHIEPHENLAETFKTFSLQQSAHYLQKVYGVSRSTKEIIDGINRLVEQFYLEKAALKPYAAQTLQCFYRQGIPMCIATATDEALVSGALRRCGVLNCFSKIFTCTSVGASKNEPLIYQAALEHLGTAKAETWVFEDALHAAQTAKADGFPVVGVYDPAETHSSELRALADFYIHDFFELSCLTL